MTFKLQGPNSILYNEDKTVYRLGMKRPSGLWSVERHERFLDALELYPYGPWKSIAKYCDVKSSQAESHAQKHRINVEEHRSGLSGSSGRALAIRVKKRQQRRSSSLPERINSLPSVASGHHTCSKELIYELYSNVQDEVYPCTGIASVSGFRIKDTLSTDCASRPVQVWELKLLQQFIDDLVCLPQNLCDHPTQTDEMTMLGNSVLADMTWGI